jgi:hypothetical protein
MENVIGLPTCLEKMSYKADPDAFCPDIVTTLRVATVVFALSLKHPPSGTTLLLEELWTRPLGEFLEFNQVRAAEGYKNRPG